MGMTNLTIDECIAYAKRGGNATNLGPPYGMTVDATHCLGKDPDRPPFDCTNDLVAVHEAWRPQWRNLFPSCPRAVVTRQTTNPDGVTTAGRHTAYRLIPAWTVHLDYLMRRVEDGHTDAEGWAHRVGVVTLVAWCMDSKKLEPGPVDAAERARYLLSLSALDAPAKQIVDLVRHYP